MPFFLGPEKMAQRNAGIISDDGRGGELSTDLYPTGCEPYVEMALYELKDYFNHPNCIGFDQFYKMISKITV